ncbi:MAG: hypothetical protein ABFQ62_01420 [Patescibacteria group bacterium]
MKSKKLDLSQEIMKTIEKEHIKMKPHWHFVLASFLMGFSVVSLISMAMFISNLIFFRLRVHEVMQHRAPEHIFLWHFLRYRFPWLHFLILILLFALGVYLLKKYEFSYKQNWKLIVLGLLGALLLSGFLIDRVGVNERLQHRRPMRRFYEQQDLPAKPLPKPAVKGMRR